MLFSQNLAAVESFLGLTLNRSSMNDVLQIIATSGGTITENAPMDRFGLTRVIRFSGGALPGVPFYTSGNFLFDKNGTLYRFNLAGPLSDANATQAYGAHVKTVIADNKLLSKTNDIMKVALSNAILTFTLNRSQNIFTEDWQESLASSPRQNAPADHWALNAFCINNCGVGTCKVYVGTGSESIDSTNEAACNQNAHQCVQDCMAEHEQ